jgi:ankyrin repeat protein
MEFIKKSPYPSAMKKILAFTMVVISLLIAGCGQRGASPRNAQTDALFRATIEGNTDLVKSLVSSPGADVNATNERGSTPLLEAARFGHDDICRVLIAAGAKLNVKDNDGKTALMLAIQNNHDDVVRVLKQAGETE